MDDQTLVPQVLAGDKDAFKELIKKNKRLVESMVVRMVKNREDCEEICMDVFLKVHDKIGDFNFQSKLSTWIGSIAYRHSLNHLRKNKISIKEIGEEEWANISDRGIDPEKLYSRQEAKEYVHSLVDELPSSYGVVITLYHLEERNYFEIAEITGFPEGTVKNYLFRGRKLLKEKLQKLTFADEI